MNKATQVWPNLYQLWKTFLQRPHPIRMGLSSNFCKQLAQGYSSSSPSSSSTTSNVHTIHIGVCFELEQHIRIERPNTGCVCLVIRKLSQSVFKTFSQTVAQPLLQTQPNRSNPNLGLLNLLLHSQKKLFFLLLIDPLQT